MRFDGPYTGIKYVREMGKGSLVRTACDGWGSLDGETFDFEKMVYQVNMKLSIKLK